MSTMFIPWPLPGFDCGLAARCSQFAVHSSQLEWFRWEGVYLVAGGLRRVTVVRVLLTFRYADQLVRLTQPSPPQASAALHVSCPPSVIRSFGCSIRFAIFYIISPPFSGPPLQPLIQANSERRTTNHDHIHRNSPICPTFSRVHRQR